MAFYRFVGIVDPAASPIGAYAIQLSELQDHIGIDLFDNDVALNAWKRYRTANPDHWAFSPRNELNHLLKNGLETGLIVKTPHVRVPSSR